VKRVATQPQDTEETALDRRFDLDEEIHHEEIPIGPACSL